MDIGVAVVRREGDDSRVRVEGWRARRSRMRCGTRAQRGCAYTASEQQARSWRRGGAGGPSAFAKV